jgi:class 3 adenylate cyclase
VAEDSTELDTSGNGPPVASGLESLPQRDPATTRSLRHELRTPINQIIGYSEMLVEEAEAAQQTAFIPDLQKIGAAARRLLTVIDEVFESTGKQAALEATATRPAITEIRLGASGAEAGAASGPAPSSARLLVVDDNELNRDMLSRRLKARGYQVETADDGHQALAAIERQSFDLVLLDIMMPGLSGLEVLQILRRKYSDTDLPIIMATAMNQGEDVVQAFKLGANDYVTKPLDFPVVLVRTETQLSRKSAVQEIQRLARELELRNQFIRKTFGRYLSEEVVSSLLETPHGLSLGGEKRVVSILMSDLRGFSSLCEQLTPEQVVRMLNNYLGTMADIISKYQGTIDEFIGDAILALFGAPVQREDDALRATACAVAMQRAMEEVNEWNRREGLPDIEMGIAVNTGEVVVGNLGSQKRTKYGVIGSHVNLAARIESYTVGGQVLISAGTRNFAGERLVVGEQMLVDAKGFKSPITVYDLRGVEGEHAIYLPQKQDTLRALVPEIPLRFRVLEGKHVAKEQLEGQMVRLSQSGAEVRVAAALQPLSNIWIHLTGLNGVQIPGDLYAKVMEPSKQAADSYLICFTSVPPEVKSFLQSALASQTQ